MSKKVAAIPNVVPGAVLSVIDEKADRPVLVKVAECIYTPKAINNALKANGLKAGWVTWACGREYWFAGDQLAIRS